MKKTLLKLLMLMLVLTLAIGLVACNDDVDTDGNGTGDGTGNGTGDGTGDGTGTNDKNYGDAENLLLIDGNVANFRVVTTNEVSGSMIKNAQKFVENLRELGITVEDAIKDNSPSDVSDCEIIIGSGVRYRDEKYVISDKSLGDKGYVIKIVDNKVLIAGGTEDMTNTAWNYFLKNVIDFTAKTDNVDNLTLKRDYVKLVETDYLIDSIKIAGNDLSEYTLFFDFAGQDKYYTMYSSALQSDIYKNSGYWLEQANIENIEHYEKKFVVRYVDAATAGEGGFHAYVDESGSFYIECAYANAFGEAAKHLITDLILDEMGDITISKTFDKSYRVDTVYYSDFGAKGDGQTDDWEALYNTHVFANQCGQKVMGDKDAVYYLHVFSKTIPIKTDVDFNDAVFHLNDIGSEIYKVRNVKLFTLERDYAKKTINAQQIQMEIPDAKALTTDTKLDWLVPYLEAESFVRLTNDHRDFIRHGANINGGSKRTDIIIVNKDGTLHEDTPIIFDFVAGTQLMNTGIYLEERVTANLTNIEIYRVDDKPITVENGNFVREACEVVADTNMDNKYHAHYRGFYINRSNATIKNLSHELLSEPFIETTGYGWNADGTKLSQSYPYYGFLLFMDAYNVKVYDCDLTGHTTYYEDKSASSATPVAMGTYDIVVEHSSNIYCEGLTNGVDIADSQYWGIMSSNGSKNMTFVDCSMSRFDAHQGFWNSTLINCELGRFFNVVGGGNLYAENVRRVVGGTFISLRGDYGATFRGDIQLINCSHDARSTYRGGATDPNYFNVLDSITLISAGFSANYKGQYVEGNAAAFPYLKWDFGYTCYMPQDLYIDNFKLNDTNPNAKVYVYNNLADAMFVKPQDFLNSIDYLDNLGVPKKIGGTANGRDMTEDDVYYNQYQITKKITYKNMTPLQMSASKQDVLWSIPVYIENENGNVTPYGE